MTEPLGLFKKYQVTKGDGTPLDPQARVFVLRLDSDPFARAAARQYAADVRRRNPILARELIDLCNELDGAVHDARMADERARRNGNGANGGGR